MWMAKNSRDEKKLEEGEKMFDDERKFNFQTEDNQTTMQNNRMNKRMEFVFCIWKLFRAIGVLFSWIQNGNGETAT